MLWTYQNNETSSFHSTRLWGSGQWHLRSKRYLMILFLLIPIILLFYRNKSLKFKPGDSHSFTSSLKFLITFTCMRNVIVVHVLNIHIINF